MEERQRKMSVKRTLCVLLVLTLSAGVLAGCRHEHVPGPAATCTTPQICTECEEILVPAKGHAPGAEASCTEAQVCTVCGEVLVPAKGHVPGAAPTCTEAQVCTVCGEVLAPANGHQPESRPEGQVCTVCGKLIASANAQYTPPHNSGASEPTPAELIPETTAEGHYHADIKPYKSGAVVIAGDYGYEQVYAASGGSGAYAEVVNAFAAKYPALNVTSVIVPKCAVFHSVDGYRTSFDSARDFIQNTYAQMDGRIRKADAIGVMAAHAGEYLFYRTDHHWTGLGAYYASVAYCQANGITPYALDTYETVVKTGFIGTLNSFAGGDANLKRNPDYTVGHYPHVGYSMTIGSRGAVAINPNANSYAGMYIGGDNPLTVIDTDNHNGRVLILFKESYGNAFAPYMIDYYERVIVVDVRKTTDPVADLIANYGVTDALIINNIQAVIGNLSDVRRKLLS